MTNFVLVHGAWVGGWTWRANAQALRKAGHEAYTPTMTGIGERIHLMSPSINLDTHITDILNVIKHEELSDVVLVGHSYGGMVITGAADALPDKITSLVYLDAFVPENDKSLVSLIPPGATPRSGQRVYVGALAGCCVRCPPGSCGIRRCTHYAAPDRVLYSGDKTHRRRQSR